MVVASRVRIDLHDEVSHKVGVGDVLDPFDAPVAFAANRAGTHIEGVHGGFQFVAGKAKHVGVHVLIEDDGVLLHHGLQHLNLIAQTGRLLEFKLGAGLFHVAGQLRDIRPSKASGHDANKLFAQPSMFVRFNLIHAGSRAFADRGQQAGSAGQLSFMKYIRGAGTYRKGAQQLIEAVPQLPHLGVWAEVTSIAAFARPRDPHAGNLLPRADRQIRIGLVVAELHVEPRIELLDPRVLKRQRFQLSGNNRPLQTACRKHHGLCARMQQIQWLEIIGKPIAQVLGLAYINDAPLPIAPLIHTRLGRNVRSLRSKQITRIPQQRRPIRIHLRRSCAFFGSCTRAFRHQRRRSLAPLVRTMPLDIVRHNPPLASSSR